MEPTYTFTADRATSWEIIRALMRHADALRDGPRPRTEWANEVDRVAGVILMAHQDAYGELDVD